MSYSKKEMNAYLKEKYYRLKKIVFDILGNKCASCGATTNLQIDHKNKTLKSFNVTTQLRVKPWNQILEEVKKCQLLCKKCHDKKTKDEFSNYGSKCPGAKLSEENIIEIRKLLDSKVSLRKIGAMYGVSHVNILHIKHNKIWRAGRVV